MIEIKRTKTRKSKRNTSFECKDVFLRNSNVTNQKIAQILKEASKTKILHLGANQISNEGIKKLAQKEWENLQQLQLTKNNIDQQVLNLFAEKQTFPILNTLHIGNNNIIKIQLSGKKFSALKELNLGNNEIYSLENISKQWMPNLINLYLDNNKIIKIRQLWRKKLKNMKFLGIQNNPIKDIESVNMFFSLQQLQLKLQYEKNYQSICIGESNSYQVKTKIKYVGLISKHRIEEKRVNEKLKDLKYLGY